MRDRHVIYGNLVLVLGPAGDPVSVPEAKDQSRVLVDLEDHLLESYIESATGHMDGRDGILNRALMTQTWDYMLPYFPVESCLMLPLAPVQSITSITYKDTNGAPQTFSGSNYSLSADKHHQPKVHLGPTASWPATQAVPDAVTIRAVYGYTKVPEPIRQAIVLLAAHFFENREGVLVGEIAVELPFGIRALLEPYMRASF
jgi:uncharacterized phiE125 gp8 family phage protein